MPEELTPFNLTGIPTSDKATLTISTGDITPATKVVIVAAQTGTTDDLDGIVTSSIQTPGDADGAELILFADAGDTITIRHNQNAAATKNILTSSGSSITLTGNAWVLLVYHIDLDTNGAWVVIDVDHDALTNFAADEHLVWATSGVGTVHINNIDDASVTAQGVIEVATAAETTTGTDAARSVSPDGLAGSEYGERAVQIVVFDFTTDVTTGNDAYFFHIDARIALMDLVDVHAEVITAGTTGNTDIQLRNVTQSNADILSTVMRIETGETATDTSAQPGTIDTDEDDMQENDLIAVDIDAVQTTAPKGLIITLGFRLP